MILSTFTKVASHGLRGAATKQSFRKWRFLSFLDSPLRSCVGYLSLSPRAFGESRPWGPVCPCNLRASPILFQHSYILCVSGRASITLPVAFYRKFHSQIRSIMVFLPTWQWSGISGKDRETEAGLLGTFPRTFTVCALRKLACFYIAMTLSLDFTLQWYIRRETEQRFSCIENQALSYRHSGNDPYL